MVVGVGVWGIVDCDWYGFLVGGDGDGVDDVCFGFIGDLGC